MYCGQQVSRYVLQFHYTKPEIQSKWSLMILQGWGATVGGLFNSLFQRKELTVWRDWREGVLFKGTRPLCVGLAELYRAAGKHRNTGFPSPVYPYCSVPWMRKSDGEIA